MRQTFRSPIGSITVTAGKNGLEEIVIGKTSSGHKSTDASAHQGQKALKQFGSALKDYFEGNRNAFDKLPVTFQGTPFQQTVLKQMRKVKAGKVVSYGELAKSSGHPGAARAVGTVCSSNRLPLVIPCHRVVGTSGLGGYSGGGLSNKRKLLRHEGVQDIRKQ